MDKVFKLSKDTVINERLISKLISAHQGLVAYYTKMDRYYEGKHKIKSPNSSEYVKVIEIISNRTKYIVDIYNGYFIGKPIKLKCDDEKMIDKLENIDKINSSNQVNRVISKNMAKYGHAFDLVFTDEEANIRYVYLDNKEVVYVYDNTVLEKPLFAIHYTNVKNFLSDKSFIKGTVYGLKEQIFFEERNGKYVITDRKFHNFDGVQITEYIENDERIGAIEPLISLQDGYNQSLTDKATANGYFADSYLKIIGVDLDTDDYENGENSLVADLKAERIIYINKVAEGASQPVVEFLSKPSNDSGEENLLNRIKDDMHTISHIPDFKNLSFSNTSAEAIKLAMWDLDNICAEKEDNFKEALANRYALIVAMNNELNIVDNSSKLFNIDFVFSRNIPQNTTVEIENAVKVGALLSQKTRLEMLPSVVTDVDSELSRIKSEQSDIVMDYGFDDE